MPRMGLNKQIIVSAAIELIEQDGFENFSMRGLASKLNVKTASLYNHVDNMDDIMVEVGRYAITALNQTEFTAIEGLKKDAAIFALAMAYRDFAKERPEMYKVVMSLHKSQSAEVEKTAKPITAPFMQALSGFPLNEEQKMHWQRVLRSILHGFLAQEEAGYFCHFPIMESNSFSLAIQCFIDGLNAAISKEAH